MKNFSPDPLDNTEGYVWVTSSPAGTHMHGSPTKGYKKFQEPGYPELKRPELGVDKVVQETAVLANGKESR